MIDPPHIRIRAGHVIHLVSQMRIGAAEQVHALCETPVLLGNQERGFLTPWSNTTLCDACDLIAKGARIAYTRRWKGLLP